MEKGINNGAKDLDATQGWKLFCLRKEDAEKDSKDRKHQTLKSGSRSNDFATSCTPAVALIQPRGLPNTQLHIPKENTRIHRGRIIRRVATKECREHQSLETHHPRCPVRDRVHGDGFEAIDVDVEDSVVVTCGFVELHDHVDAGPGPRGEVEEASADGFPVLVIALNIWVLAKVRVVRHWDICVYCFPQETGGRTKKGTKKKKRR